jgi:hypothetical protein
MTHPSRRKGNNFEREVCCGCFRRYVTTRYALVSSGEPAEAVRMITTGTKACRSTGATFLMPLYVSNLAAAYAELGQFDDAWRRREV